MEVSVHMGCAMSQPAILIARLSPCCCPNEILEMHGVAEIAYFRKKWIDPDSTIGREEARENLRRGLRPPRFRFLTRHPSFRLPLTSPLLIFYLDQT